jgi:DNA-binding NarL/FixJ family response regulator
VDAMHDRVPDVPIVVLTGHEDEQAGAEAVRHDARDYLVKDEVGGRGLSRAIDYAIGRREARAKLEQSRKQVSMNEKLASLGALVSGMTEQVRTSTTEITNALFQIRQRIQETAREPRVPPIWSRTWPTPTRPPWTA